MFVSKKIEDSLNSPIDVMQCYDEQTSIKGYFLKFDKKLKGF